MRRSPTTLTKAMAAALAGCCLMAGCASSETSEASGEPTPTSSTQPSTTPTVPSQGIPNVDKQAVADLWDSILYDYTPVDNSSDLVDSAEIKLAITGRVIGFAEGPILFAESADDPEAALNVVMSVEVDEVFKGDRPASGKVYVRLDATQSLEHFTQALPPGTLVALYLDPSPAEQGNLIIGNDGAGRPQGEDLWQVGPQGFVVADGANGGVVFPIDPQIAPDAEFEDQIPAEPRASTGD